jgi:hypothetical protein
MQVQFFSHPRSGGLSFPPISSRQRLSEAPPKWHIKSLCALWFFQGSQGYSLGSMKAWVDSNKTQETDQFWNGLLDKTLSAWKRGCLHVGFERTILDWNTVHGVDKLLKTRGVVLTRGWVCSRVGIWTCCKGLYGYWPFKGAGTFAPIRQTSPKAQMDG